MARAEDDLELISFDEDDFHEDFRPKRGDDAEEGELAATSRYSSQKRGYDEDEDEEELNWRRKKSKSSNEAEANNKENETNHDDHRTSTEAQKKEEGSRRDQVRTSPKASTNTSSSSLSTSLLPPSAASDFRRPAIPLYPNTRYSFRNLVQSAYPPRPMTLSLPPSPSPYPRPPVPFAGKVAARRPEHVTLVQSPRKPIAQFIPVPYDNRSFPPPPRPLPSSLPSSPVPPRPVLRPMSAPIPRHNITAIPFPASSPVSNPNRVLLSPKMSPSSVPSPSPFPPPSNRGIYANRSLASHSIFPASPTASKQQVIANLVSSLSSPAPLISSSSSPSTPASTSTSSSNSTSSSSTSGGATKVISLNQLQAHKNTIIIKNVPKTTTRQTLSTLFTTAGQIAELNMENIEKGEVVIRYEGTALLAKRKFQGHNIDGSRITIDFFEAKL